MLLDCPSPTWRCFNEKEALRPGGQDDRTSVDEKTPDDELFDEDLDEDDFDEDFDDDFEEDDEFDFDDDEDDDEDDDFDD